MTKAYRNDNKTEAKKKKKFMMQECGKFIKAENIGNRRK